MPRLLCLSLLAVFFQLPAATYVTAAEPSFEEDLLPFLNAHCVRCHNDQRHEGDFRLNKLSREVGQNDTQLWAEVMGRISSGEMPPDDVKNRPAVEQSAAIVEWLAARIKEGDAARMARRDRVSYHRLTREEYVNTVRDLIGVEYDATDPGGLLEDSEWNGFERIGSVLTLSATHIEKYMAAAETILAEAYPDKKIEYLEASKRAVVLDPNHPHYERIKEAGLLDKVRYEMTTSGEIFRGSNPYTHGLKFPGPGIYEMSYTVCGLRPKHGPAPRLQVYEYKLDRILFEQDIVAPEDQPVTVTFQAHFPDVRSPSTHVINTAGIGHHPRTNAHSRIPFVTTQYPRAPWQMKITDEHGTPRYPVLIIDAISMRGPILTEQDQRRRDEYMPHELGDREQVRKGLAALATRAFRRPLYPGELDNYLQIVQSEMAAGEEPRNAIKTAMTAILCSKSFLFLAEGSEDAERHMLSDWEIASRLSYLLWSTMPDDELLAAAEQGKLRNREELARQFDRLLADPRAKRFGQSFATQWLRLRNVGKFPPDKKLYPNYDAHLEQSMVGETTAFFQEVLDQGLTLREFLSSDWTMVNPRLARFYGIPGISDDRFQRVDLKPEFHRGGLLTQASILSLTSDGTRQRPVHRGAWVSEAIFGKTPPPPPANVDPIEPNPVDAPKATLRMKLEAHKHDPTCAACHRKIDPLGLAFDNYNAIGQWRTHEVVTGTGDNPLVDPSGELPDGRKFKDAEQFKQLLLADLDGFSQAFLEKLAIYGLRRTLTFDDRDELDAIARTARQSDYRVRDMVKAFVLSDLFQNR